MELKLNKDNINALKLIKELQAQMRLLTKLIQKQYGSRKQSK